MHHALQPIGATRTSPQSTFSYPSKSSPSPASSHPTPETPSIIVTPAEPQQAATLVPDDTVSEQIIRIVSSDLQVFFVPASYLLAFSPVLRERLLPPPYDFTLHLPEQGDVLHLLINGIQSKPWPPRPLKRLDILREFTRTINKYQVCFLRSSIVPYCKEYILKGDNACNRALNAVEMADLALHLENEGESLFVFSVAHFWSAPHPHGLGAGKYAKDPEYMGEEEKRLMGEGLVKRLEEAVGRVGRDEKGLVGDWGRVACEMIVEGFHFTIRIGNQSDQTTQS